MSQIFIRTSESDGIHDQSTMEKETSLEVTSSRIDGFDKVSVSSTERIV